MTQRVLVVESDPAYRLVLRRALEAHPHFSVEGEAADGRSATALAEATRPDLVLFDCSPPDALVALAELRAAAPQARVVLVSDQESPEVELASPPAGTLGVLARNTPALQIGRELDALAGLVQAVHAAVERSTRLAAKPASARAARRFVLDALAGAAPPDLEETVVLLASELVTNAVVHVGGEIEVLVRLTPTAVRVEVTDGSEVTPSPRRAGADDTSGRGLTLVEALARRWGVDAIPPGGKTVWFEVDRL